MVLLEMKSDSVDYPRPISIPVRTGARLLSPMQPNSCNLGAACREGDQPGADVLLAPAHLARSRHWPNQE